MLALCSLHKTVSLVGPGGEMDHVGYIVITLLMYNYDDALSTQ